MTPEVLVYLANLGRPRRPRGFSAPSAEPVLLDLATARRQVAGLTGRLISGADLAGLRSLQSYAADAAGLLLAGDVPAPGPLNELARDSRARVQLTITDGTPRHEVVWEDGSVVAHLARRLIEELAAIEPGRLRECARPDCTLLFYDTTRSRTRRWHAEVPCGWRERQHTHRLPTRM